MPKTVELPSPTPDLVVSYVQKFDDSQATVERALSKLFTLFPNNDKPEDVLLKVITLNALYSTGILATFKVAEHIFRLNIDAEIRAGLPGAVHRIAHVQLGENTRNNYSFATKYCAWHNPISYPIYDSFIDQMLWGYKKQDRFDNFYRQDLWQYDRFTKIMFHFRDHYNLTAYSIKDIDKFLWLAGYNYFPPSWKKPISELSAESNDQGRG
jgi:hypothetical protein